MRDPFSEFYIEFKAFYWTNTTSIYRISGFKWINLMIFSINAYKLYNSSELRNLISSVQS